MGLNSASASTNSYREISKGENSTRSGGVDEPTVLPGWRRRDVERALLLECLRGLGAPSARLPASSANPHRSYDLYESAGFERRTEHVRYRRPFDA